MKDFGETLARWESQGGPVPEKDEPTASKNLPSRTVMEKHPADDEIDLHGLLREKAVLLLRNFLSQSRQTGYSKVRVIHGKGLHSLEGKAVLKEAVRHVLVKNPHVAAWGETPRNQGGSGAVWVWLNVPGK
jgi:hypothetical protein